MKPTLTKQLMDLGIIERERDISIFMFMVYSVATVAFSAILGPMLREAWGLHPIAFSVSLAVWAFVMWKMYGEMLENADNVYIVKRVVRP